VTFFEHLLRGTALCAMIVGAQHAVLAAGNPEVQLTTSMGVMVLELYPDKAPVTVDNFLNYVRSGHYDGTIFHRTVYGWIIQGGGYDAQLNELDTGDAIVNEAGNGLRNERGTIAMARLGEPDSATAQFFINLQDNPGLDHKGESRRSFGYCVFGRVISGMDVADAIGEVQTHEVADFDVNVPIEPVILVHATLLPQ
jgi:peptidyl-prolyl cis-trans isomerase A (cyclophilin A)